MSLHIDVVLMYNHRQILTFIEIATAAVGHIRADVPYVPRGSLQYEFDSELLQTPIQLLRITNAEAQVLQERFPLFLEFILWQQILRWEMFCLLTDC